MADATVGLQPPPESDRNGVAVVFPLPEDVRRKLVQAGGTPVQDLHLTLGYLGDIEDINISQAILTMITRSLDTEGVTARVNGVARFNGEEQDAIVALVDNQGLPEVRAEFERLLAEDNVELDSEHGFTPHITLGYVDKDGDTPNIRLDDIEFDLDSPSVWWGDERQEDLDADAERAESTGAGKDKSKKKDKTSGKGEKAMARKKGSKKGKECHKRARSVLATLTGLEEKNLVIAQQSKVSLVQIDTSGTDVFKAENKPRALKLRRSIQNRKTPINTTKLGGRTRV